MNKEYIVLSRQDAVARNNSPYVNLKVANKEEVENICVFDVPKTSGPKVGQLVRFLNIRENQGKKSATNMDMIAGTFPTENHPLYTLVPRPIKREEWDRCIEAVLKFCKDEVLIDFVKQQADALFPQYSKYPAATSVHHAFPGGLLNHTYQMLHMFEGLYPCLPYPIKPERVILAVMFHDYGKVYEYNRQGDTQPEMYLLGHIYLSAHKLNNVLDEKGIPQEEVKRIVHCVLAHHGEREYGSPVVPCTQEASIVTYLDNISAKTDIMEGAGDMEQNYYLGTHVVK